MFFFEDFKYTLQNIWRYKITNVPQVHLAVVGLPASGKSYLIYDIMRAFACMGHQQYNYRKDGVTYCTPTQYEGDVIMGGTMEQTPLYPCRQENHYGTQCHKGRSKFDIDYLNIPGETFQDKDNVKLFFRLYNTLNTGKKNFRIVTWTRVTGDKELVVEPLHGDTTKLDEARKADAELLEGFRTQDYLPWDQIFAELHVRGFKPTSKSKKISGKKLLKNLMKYNVDSVMRSIATIAEVSSLDEYNNCDKSRFLRKFYFLNYCNNATDVVICDKMLVPKEANRRVQSMTFGDLCTNLQELFTSGGSRPNVYLAFRGVDFLLQGCEDKYNEIKSTIDNDSDIQVKSEEQRNAQYSVFAYAMWQCIDPRTKIDRREIKDCLGIDLSNDDFDHLQDHYINLDNPSCAVADGSTSQSYITTSIGSQGGKKFLDLLNYSYPNLNLQLIENPIDYIKPHIYFTCTPITEDFLIYRNDPDAGYARFFTDSRKGAARYFDQCGSNLCFGSYQLALDIMRQHNINNDNVYDLLERCQATQ